MSRNAALLIELATVVILQDIITSITSIGEMRSFLDLVKANLIFIVEQR